MRRKDREVVEREEILAIIKRCDVCRLALNDDGYPYVVPLNFGLVEKEDGSLRLVFHSALEGRKLELIARDPRASFEMDCRHELRYDESRGVCTMAYESVIGRGTVEILKDEEKAEALQALVDQYYPGQKKYYNPAAISRTAVYALDVESVTGKRNMPKW